MRKRDRESFEASTCTYVYAPKLTKHQPQQALCPTALALVENPTRLTSYVNQLSPQYLNMFINDTVPLNAMTLVLKNNNFFWFLVHQRVVREAGFNGNVEYQKLVKQTF